jgi:hypothetical protein
VAIISIDGILGLSSVLSLDRAASNKVALSNKIVGAYAKATKLYGNNFGWEAISYPALNQVLFNIPVTENVEQHQYTLNTLTGSFCRFKGLNANTWCFHSQRLFFGDNSGRVWRADDTYSDNGQPIAGFIKTAFKFQGKNQLKKIYKMVKAFLFSDLALAFGVSLALDFDETEVPPPGGSSNNTSGLSVWNTATWDVDPWATDVLISPWRKVKGEGRCASVLFATNTSGFPVRVASFMLLYEDGGIL